MGEREPIPDNEDSYWADDLAIGEIPLFGETSTVRLRLHISDEAYHGREELYPLSHPSGQPTYVHGRPYVSEPVITPSCCAQPKRATRSGRSGTGPARGPMAPGSTCAA